MTATKICTKCKVEKEEDSFFMDNRTNKRRGKCKKCMVVEQQTHRTKQTTKEKMKIYKKTGYERHKQKISDRRKAKWHSEEEKQKRYIKKLERKIRLQQEKLEKAEERLARRRETKRKNHIKERSTPHGKIHHSVGNVIREQLRHSGIKKDRKWEKLLGYTTEELKKHLENLFTPDMNWDNYGTYWHIDHIRPKSWFSFTSVEDLAFRECWALSNLQPLEAKKNLSKNNRYEG